MTEQFIPRAQEVYRHFKGNLYQVLAVAEHTESGEMLVIYQALYGEYKIYARPLEMFTSLVDRTKYPDAEQEFRFQLQESAMRASSDSGYQKEESAMRAPSDSSRQEEAAVTAPAVEGEDRAVSAVMETEPEEPALDPLVLEFLDARTYEERLNVLTALHHRITDDMITMMAMCCDIEVASGDVEQRYEDLKQCLITKDRFEIKRLG
ncbi:MAG: DUF1653 domain-containing protein [bacterium]|nr:DUF1653 domain-containing protein [bacterium]MCM1375371.1 DUF1653 domain-containing protein [Muribaculum sp.]